MFSMKSAPVQTWALPNSNKIQFSKVKIVNYSSIKPFSRYRVNLSEKMPDPCSDKLGLPAGRSGVISDENGQISKILSGQKWAVSGNLGSNIYGNCQGS